MRALTCGIVLAMGAFLLLASTTARADWDPKDPYKYLQMPDLTETGIDINATFKGPNEYPYYKVLADDFPCYKPGYITDIHVWGSWLNDQVNKDVKFKLSIHEDIPAVPGALGSRPGKLLWSTIMQPTQSRLYALSEEAFYDPNQNLIIGRDTQVWQYNFIIPATEAFYQVGSDPTGTAPHIYWLDVMAILPPTAPEVFGWKTRDWREGHYMDDAVWADVPTAEEKYEVPIGGWHELTYDIPGFNFPNIPNRSIDMAFVITPEPGSLILLGGVGGLALLRRRR